MKALIIKLIIAGITLSSFAQAHPGRTDKNGGHRDKKTGEYHKH